MNWFSLLLAFQLSGIVDRIEGKHAVVEWSDGSFSDVPTTVFRRWPMEGESIQIRMRESSYGPAIAITIHPTQITFYGDVFTLPNHARFRLGHHYSICIRLPQERSCWF